MKLEDIVYKNPVDHDMIDEENNCDSLFRFAVNCNDKSESREWGDMVFATLDLNKADLIYFIQVFYDYLNKTDNLIDTLIDLLNSNDRSNIQLVRGILTHSMRNIKRSKKLMNKDEDSTSR